MFIRVAPWIFVVLWSTGYIGMKAAAPYAEPMTFLAIRFLAVFIIIAIALPLFRIPVLSWRDSLLATMIGASMHGIYLGGIMYAIKVGMPAAVAALIIALQPILTAVLAGPILGERLTWRHWTSLALGIGGIFLVLSPKIGLDSGWANRPETFVASVVSIAALTFGTLYQKRSASHLDLRASLLPQYFGATLVTGAWAFSFESREVIWSPELIGALAWLVIVLSIGAISLFLLLLRENAAWRTSALFYMIPPVTAVIAWVMFDERLSLVQLGGMALVMAAVLAIRPGRPPPEVARV
jgi:drug/metabolite transporter (DMT)-like permease